jgi:hypothetical protein
LITVLPPEMVVWMFSGTPAIAAKMMRSGWPGLSESRSLFHRVAALAGVAGTVLT